MPEAVLRKERAGRVAAPADGFRRDINGLRGVAVVAVVLYHFSLAGFSGGFVGVDMFFVISGYLMTRIVVGKLEAHRFGLLEFYAARTRRIVPALLFLVFCLLAAGWFVLTPYEYRALGKQAAAAVTFISNMVFLTETGYFDPLSDGKWLLHTWSLSVEWQFYLLFPLFVSVLYRSHGRRAITIWIWIVLGASFVVSVAASRTFVSAGFYLLPTRVWELLLGAVVFMHGSRIRQRRGAAALGLLMIAASVLAYSGSTSFPGYAAALPTIGAALVIGARSENVLLNSAPVQFLGTISYSLYLWHWPIFVAGRAFDASEALRWAGLIAAVPAAYFSYRFVERYFHSRRAAVTWRTIAGYAGGVSAIATVGAVIFFMGGIAYSQRGRAELPQAESLLAYTTRYDYSTPMRRGECLLLPEQSFAALSSACFETGAGGAATVLWGDSHAGHLYYGLRASGELAQLTASACPPLADYDSTYRVHCHEFNQRVMDWIRARRPHVVILAAYWDSYRGTVDISTQLAKTSGLLRQAGVARIVLVGPVPGWHGALPLRLYKQLYRTGRVESYSASGLVRGGLELDRDLRRIADRLGIRYVSLVEALCHEGACMTTLRVDDDLVPMQFDDSHFTAAGSRYVAERVESELRDELADGRSTPIQHQPGADR